MSILVHKELLPPIARCGYAAGNPFQLDSLGAYLGAGDVLSQLQILLLDELNLLSQLLSAGVLPDSLRVGSQLLQVLLKLCIFLFELPYLLLESLEFLAIRSHVIKQIQSFLRMRQERKVDARLVLAYG